MAEKPIQVIKNAPVASESIVEGLAEILRLLGDHTRLWIVMACAQAPASVGAIAARLRLSDSLVNHPLRLLRGARLVKSKRSGRLVFYVVADDHVSELLSNMSADVDEPSEGRLA